MSDPPSRVQAATTTATRSLGICKSGATTRVALARAIKGDVAIGLVQHNCEFACGLAEDFAVMDRGAVVIAGAKADRVEHAVRARLTV